MLKSKMTLYAVIRDMTWLNLMKAFMEYLEGIYLNIYLCIIQVWRIVIHCTLANACILFAWLI